MDHDDVFNTKRHVRLHRGAVVPGVGVRGRFLYFPDEFHFVTRPRNRRLWWATVHDWLASYLRPEGRGVVGR